MTLSLIYGADATGKSLHCKTLCEAFDTPLYISLELKNRRMLSLDARTGVMTKDTPFDVFEAVVLEKPPKYDTDLIATYNKLGEVLEKILNNKGLDGKPKHYDIVVIDGVSDLSKMAEKIVIKELQKKQPTRQEIGKNDLASWEVRNNLACMPLERIANWAQIESVHVIVTSLLTGEYVNDTKVGYKIAVQDRIKEKASAIRVKLVKDGRGYIADFEKVPNWANDGDPTVKVMRGGLVAEFGKRGLL